MSKTTPMIKQYRDIKKEHEDKILFFRVGDFYEMFFEDARTAARELEIVLTSRETGKGNHVPLAGVPYHAANSYIARLIEKGYKVAVCEQMEEARFAKGLVKREVTRVYTPGTILDDNLLPGSINNYLCSLFKSDEGIGMAAVDVSTGEFVVTQIEGEERYEKLKDELIRFGPAECLYNSALENDSIIPDIVRLIPGMVCSTFQDHFFHYLKASETLKEHFNTVSLEGYGLSDFPLAVSAGGAVISYLKNLHKGSLKHINSITLYHPYEYMLVDGITRRNLELFQTIRTGRKKGSLLGVMDKTVTSPGARLLKKWMEQPLLEAGKIEERLQGIEELVEDLFIREDLASLLEQVYDLERIVSRINFGSANPRDLIHLKKSLKVFPALQNILFKLESSIFKNLENNFHPLDDLCQLIHRAVVDDPPLLIKEGGLIKDGYDRELDNLREISRHGKKWILNLEKQEKERTGIKSLKVNYNKVFGYYIEVTKPNLSHVPDNYIRKQTLVNSERFIIPELKEFEEKIFTAEERIKERESILFDQVRKKAAEKTVQIQKSASVIAVLDCLLNLARLALENNYCRPVFNDRGGIKIKGGRHPVVEKFLKDERFVPNDTILDEHNNSLLIITGPNMAGKSTYMRQAALIVLMAQMGSFVPAKEAVISPVDRIFARVGASDDLVGGQSTFMVEMNEAANILNNATSKSLVILDEIGRGTSTFDGMSIARAVIEYLHDKKTIGAKTLFATHYHELTGLADRLPGVKNYSIAVKEEGEDIVFLRKVIPQRADRSYGIQVARLAGLPLQAVKRAEEILRGLENKDEILPGEIELSKSSAVRDSKPQFVKEPGYINGETRVILEELRNVDTLNMTPLEALNKLFELQDRLKDLQLKKGGN